MIKLEEELVEAIKNRKCFKKKDLRVEQYYNTSYIYFKDRNIAVIDYEGSHKKEIRLYSQGLNSKALRNRLNAILTVFDNKYENNDYVRSYIHQYKHNWYLKCIKHIESTNETKVLRNDLFEEGISIKFYWTDCNE